MSVQYAYTILYVPNVPQTMQFYEQAFGFAQKFVTPEKDYGELVSGATTIAFANLELGQANFGHDYAVSQPGKPPFGIELAFTTQNVPATMARAIEHGATLFKPAATKPWGQQVGYVQDPNGFLIEICTPMQPPQ